MPQAVIGCDLSRAFIQHTGYARTKAEAWWLRRATAPVPRTIQEALDRQDELEATAAIQVRRDGQFMRVARHQLAREVVA